MRGSQNVRVLGAVLGVALLSACAGEDLETRTFEVRYLESGVVNELIDPYVYAEREGAPGRKSVTQSAVTVRETAENLERIARVLEQFDRPRPTVMLNFQIVQANGAADTDPAIAEVERELRRLFRFEGYDLIAEAQVAAIQGSSQRQIAGNTVGQQFILNSGVSEVRATPDGTTLTLEVELMAEGVGNVLSTSVTIPAGHSVVLGTANTPTHEGALILVVRAELAGDG